MPSTTVDHLYDLILKQDKGPLFKDVYGVTKSDLFPLTRVSQLLDKCDFSPTYLFSAPGRTELGGNHTDHNLGKVLCSAVRKDALAAVSMHPEPYVSIHSEGFEGTFRVDLSDLDPKTSEYGTTQALIKGVLAGIKNAGGELGGFLAEITSNVGVGSGLSSSASFEVLIGTIVNSLYNDNQFTPEKIASIGQFAENTFFGKPCGLMDQTASAVGGIIKIDFEYPDDPQIHKVDYDLQDSEYVLLVVNSGSSHADLTPAYSSIPIEMTRVANSLDTSHLRMVNENHFLDKIVTIRAEHGDRAVLRALHFFNENMRVDQMVAALEMDDLEAYLGAVQASGASSQNILQNAIPPQSDGREQGLAFALGLSQLFIEKAGRGVARVHGGGFAGTIQAYIHEDDLDDYVRVMSSCFPKDDIERLQIRQNGACEILRFK